MEYLIFFTDSLIRFSLLFFLLIILALSTGSCASENENPDLNIGISPIEIEWELISNFEPDNKLKAVLTLINGGENPLKSTGWSLYFNSLRLLDLDSFPEEFNVSHIGGYFFKLEPTEIFNPIEAGESRKIEYLATYFAIKISDVPEGFYFVFDDDSIEKVESVKIHPFEAPEQANRSPHDKIPVPTAGYTFKNNERLNTLKESAITKITPTPVKQTSGVGIFQFQDPTQIFFDLPFESEAQFLKKVLLNDHGIETELVRKADDVQKPGIYLKQAENGSSTSEAYSLDVTSDSIILTADAAAGLFYGVQTLRSLISNRSADALQLNAVSFSDKPAFNYRGMHLDVSRNFQSVDRVKRLLDIMALYKLNKFHFHLTDDEGWRIEIDQLPELTEIGGRRGHTETEEHYLIPVYGSGPDPTPGASFGNGWYTRDQYIDILKYATERHIEVIPEIDVPGHARAAIIAMEARAKRLMEAGDTVAAEQYRLREPEDQSVYLSVQNYTDNVINICRESTYNFMEHVIDELVKMHHLAEAPLNMIHVGGDEVPHGAWEKSPACRKLMDEQQIRNVRQLQGYFFSRVAEKLRNLELQMGGWEEVVYQEDDIGTTEINPDFIATTTPFVWSNIWGGGTEDRAYLLANEGYQVVMSHASNFYFDLAYDKHWQEPGFYWAAMLTTEAPFSFMPFNLYGNITVDNYGNPLANNHFDGMARLNEDTQANIRGLQGQLWTETVNEDGRMEYMILPRLIGLAERAWVGEPEWSRETDLTTMEKKRVIAWNEFANRLGRFELPRLDRLYDDIQYRIPPPGAIIRNNMLHANTSLPGFTIRYETGGNDPTIDSPAYEEPVKVNGTDIVKLAAFSSTGRAGRTVIAERSN